LILMDVMMTIVDGLEDNQAADDQPSPTACCNSPELLIREQEMGAA
jgi:hypothetical protein